MCSQRDCRCDFGLGYRISGLPLAVSVATSAFGSDCAAHNIVDTVPGQPLWPQDYLSRVA